MTTKILTDKFPWQFDFEIPEYSSNYQAFDYCTPFGKYLIYQKTDKNDPIEVGFFSAEKLFTNIADIHGLHISLFMDELSQEWHEIYSIISPELWERNIVPNILLLDAFVIYPEFQGRNYGLLAIKAIVKACLEIYDVIALTSYPIKDDGKFLTKEEHANISREQILDLERFYKKAGFSDRKYQRQWGTYEDVVTACKKIKPKI